MSDRWDEISSLIHGSIECLLSKEQVPTVTIKDYYVNVKEDN
jgi:hypothetical protein